MGTITEYPAKSDVTMGRPKAREDKKWCEVGKTLIAYLIIAYNWVVNWVITYLPHLYIYIYINIYMYTHIYVYIYIYIKRGETK